MGNNLDKNMDKIKIIKTEQDYKEGLKLVEDLIARDPDPDSAEGEQLSLISTLIQDYEARTFPEILPDPIEAIKFRMEQASLKPTDLIPYIGSRSRVSEILSGKRQLTLNMVRALEAGLGIPTKVLIQRPVQSDESHYQHWDTRLVRAMESYGYFGSKSFNKYSKEELLKEFFAPLGGNAQSVALFRKEKDRTSYRTSPLTHKNALDAWMIRVLEKSRKIKVPVTYKHGVIDLAFMRNLIKLSVKEKAPLLALEHLKKVGIKLVIERHLPKTYLDGALILTEKDNPVIGITIRHDNAGNFWFTLMHELAHVSRHYGQHDIDTFYDEKLLEKGGIEIDTKEGEADEWAEESILPKEKWEISPAKVVPSAMAAQSLADELGVHVTVIAGIIRFKHENYYYLHKIVNDKKARVRWLFPDVFPNSNV